MNIPPIHIRGKTRARAPSLPGTTQKRRRRQPLSATPTDGQQRKKRRKTRAGRMPSCLERLPAEILQTIFWESLNAELPLASRMLTRKLDSEHVRMEFCFRALYRPQARYASGRVEEKATDGGEAGGHEPPDEEHIAEAQTKLLQRRFFTWDFFRKYAEKARLRWRAENASKSAATALLPPAKLADREQAWRVLRKRSPYLASQETESGALFLRAGDEAERIDDMDILIDDPTRVHAQFWSATLSGFLRLHARAHIPEKLLSGRLDVARTTFLRFLVYQNLNVDADGSPALETLRHGLFDAARARNRLAFAALLKLAADNRAWPAQELLRCAVVEAGCDHEIVRQLIAGPASFEGWEVDYMDRVLWAWADREGGENGRWLKVQLVQEDRSLRALRDDLQVREFENGNRFGLGF